MKRKKTAAPAPTDTFFDGIANKFDENIYGTSKGRLRHQMLLQYLSSYVQTATPLHVLDAGGGTGMMSLEFAKAGHHVVLCDGSSEVLDIAQQRLANFANASILRSDISSLNAPESFELILCHAVLEWVQQPTDIIDKLFSQLKVGGCLSLSFFNRDAALFNNAIWGNFDYINAGLNTRNQVRLNPHNAQRPADIIAYMQSHYPTYTVEHMAGIRCFHDYLHDRSKQETEYAQLLEMEMKYAKEVPFMWLGKYFHMLIRKQ